MPKLSQKRFSIFLNLSEMVEHCIRMERVSIWIWKPYRNFPFDVPHKTLKCINIYSKRIAMRIPDNYVFIENRNRFFQTFSWHRVVYPTMNKNWVFPKKNHRICLPLQRLSFLFCSDQEIWRILNSIMQHVSTLKFHFIFDDFKLA